MKKNIKSKSIVPFKIYSWIGILGTALIFLQAIVMSQLIFLFGILGIGATIGIYHFYNHWQKCLQHQKEWARILLIIICCFHFLPAILAIFGVVNPSIDHSISAAVGTILAYFSL